MKTSSLFMNQIERSMEQVCLDYMLGILSYIRHITYVQAHGKFSLIFDVFTNVVEIKFKQDI